MGSLLQGWSVLRKLPLFRSQKWLCVQSCFDTAKDCAEGMAISRGPETQKVLRTFPIIMDYADKIHKHYFPDYEHWE